MKNVDNSVVAFQVTALYEARKTNSSLVVGNTYEGEYHASNQSILWEDPQNGEVWTFWIGDACAISQRNE